MHLRIYISTYTYKKHIHIYTCSGGPGVLFGRTCEADRGRGAGERDRLSDWGRILSYIYIHAYIYM
jgi:hypothetical protein